MTTTIDDLTQLAPDGATAAHQGGPRRGRLKIFLGAAPGVGKTYEMLSAARARKREGLDVVVGVVETHGRAETMALVDGLELVARRTCEYRGRVLDEMDLDAVLARKPRLVLVDELAHTNAPESRHPKRYLDVEELLAAGIDVYTTLNIQHVESLNNVVAQITRIRVRETVPDSILDRADDIEAIDIAPEDLMQRLREGKVYLPKQAERALKNFFSPGNLTALRELTLRRTAQRVDEQLLDHMRSHAIRGPWAAGDRLLVCVTEDRRSEALVRHTKRVADRLHASWTALHIETTRSLQFTEAQRDRVAETLRLAERLGAEPVTIPGGGRHVADDIVAYARANNLTQIVVGKTKRTRWFELVNGSVVRDLVERSGNITVQVIAGEETEEAAEPAAKSPVARDPVEFSPYAVTVAMVGAGLGVAEIIEPTFGVQNVDLVFLTAIVGVAVTFGLYPSLLAVILATLAYNFFFLPPLYTFTIADPTNVAALFFFTVVAILVSNLAARTRSQAKVAQGRARVTEALYSFSRKLASCVSIDDVLWATAYQIASMLQMRVVLLLPEDGMLALKAGYPPEDTLDGGDLAAAQWAWSNNRPAGRGSDTLPGGNRLFAPMRTGRGPVGVVGLDADKPGPLLTPEQRRLLDALLDQGALAIERVSLVEDLDRAKLLAETDRLRSSLLTSISHDLRTPLASILGSALDPARSRAGARREREARPRRHDHRGIGAAEPFHRQPPRYDAAGIGRGRAERRLDRHRRDRRRGAPPRGDDPGASSGRPDTRRRPADAGGRRRLVRAGLVQPARQCRQICRAGDTDRDPVLARRSLCPRADARRGRWHSAGGCRADLREILPRAKGRPRPRRHGPRPRHLARLHRSDGRHDRGAQPLRSPRRDLHHPPSGPRPRSNIGYSRVNALAVRILIVDDEPPIRRLLHTGLGTQGYDVIDAATGAAALDAMADKPDLVILDLGLPDMQGLDVLRLIRERGSAVPVLVLSSRDDETGKVRALDLGADDYVTKPFGMNELLARVRAALRHRLQSEGERPIFTIDGLSVDLVRRIVKVDGTETKLSPKEYELLRLLVRHAGKVLTHAFLLKEVWGPTTDPQYLRVYIRQLRQKIEPSPDRPSYIMTETGVGYRLRAAD